ncbi:hypothetical protein HW44_15320 [Nitrosococcus oceani]|nr:hypothetical protein HW44_15320 [Nitrosococcus oceani]
MLHATGVQFVRPSHGRGTVRLTNILRLFATAATGVVCLSADRNNQKIAEVLATARHYGNMRFALFTLYVTITAGLVFSVFGNLFGQQTRWEVFALKGFGVISTAVFIFFDHNINNYLLSLGKYIADRFEGSHYLFIPGYSKGTVSYIICTPEALIGLFWLPSFFLGSATFCSN